MRHGVCARRKFCGDVFSDFGCLTRVPATLRFWSIMSPQKPQTALAEGTEWHRTILIVCSIVLFQGVAVVWGKSHVYEQSAG